MAVHPKVLDDYNYLKHDYTKHWKDIFPDFGMCMTKLYDSHGYIPIPRCGSQYWLEFCDKQLGYKAEHISSVKGYYQTMLEWKPNYAVDKQFFTILRDPYERYLSALFAIFKTMDESLLDLIRDNPSLDDHHLILQKDFFYGFDLNNITFFNMNDIDFDKKITTYVRKTFSLESFVSNWRYSDNKQFIRDLLERDPKLLNIVKEYLQDDYNFLATIKFYNEEI